MGAPEPVTDGATALIRLRLAPSDARYFPGVAAGSKAMEIFADLETELCLLEGGDEGLCAGYESVEFLTPLRVGDFVEATGRVVARGRTSRKIETEISIIHSVDQDGIKIPQDGPILAVRATVTVVVGKAVAARAQGA